MKTLLILLIVIGAYPLMGNAQQTHNKMLSFVYSAGYAEGIDRDGQKSISFAFKKKQIQSSILLLIDTSGSMGGDKLKSAKKAAIASIKQAIHAQVEISILAFSGECSSPITNKINFTQDINQLTRFINNLNSGGGTPLSTALVKANVYLAKNKSPSSNNQMVVLLADGDNNDSCGSIDSAINKLKQSGTIVRHETVGLEIAPFSDAARQLQSIASNSGGSYHYAESHTQLANIFKETFDTLQMLDLFKQFGDVEQADDASQSENATQSILDMM